MKYALAIASLLFLMASPYEAGARDWQFVRSQGMTKLVLVNKSVEGKEQVYKDAIRVLCASGKHCFIKFWSDKNYIPYSFPITDWQAKGMTASYTFNPSTRYSKFLWNCRIKNDPDKCFSE